MCLNQTFRFRTYFKDKLLMENLQPSLTRAQLKATDQCIPKYQVKLKSVSPISDSVFNYILRSTKQS